MSNPATKCLIFAACTLGLASLAFGQNAQPQQQASTAPTTQTAAIDAQQAAPPENVVLFVSPKLGGQGWGFMTAPDGTAVVVPINETRAALESGYRPVLVADLLRAVDTYTQTIQDQQKKIDNLTGQYNDLAGRFNQLAAANRMDPSTYAKQQAADEKRGMRLMLFQSLLARSAPPTQVQMQVQTTNCSAYPALCVQH
jgi:hypothetical protein